MTTLTQYPNGQVLQSSALTPAQISVIMQNLTCGMLGINPPDFSQVRISWQPEGQPYENRNQDVCYVACTPYDTDYSRVRDYALGQTGTCDDAVLTEYWQYTKGWRVAWCLYGPNAEDRARMIRSALFMSYFNDQLNLVNLFPLPDPPEVTRVPENINGQWFERADYFCNFYENVNESIIDGIATSVEVKVYAATPDDPVADLAVESS